jgi:hypothetical protein
MAFNDDNRIAGAEQGGKVADTSYEDIDSAISLHGFFSRVQTGTRGFAIDYKIIGGGDDHNRFIDGSETIAQSDNHIIACSFSVGLDAAPTTEIGIIGRALVTGLQSPEYVRIGTDRKIRIYDKDGVQRGDATASLIPTSGFQEVVVIFDWITLSTVWVVVFFGTTEELAFDTTVSPDDFFDWRSSSTTFRFGGEPQVDSGCVAYLDDLVMRDSTVAGDAPHLTAYPRLRINGGRQQKSDANGSYTAWSGDYTDVDETGDHDADTTYTETTTEDAKETYKSSSANSIPAGATIHSVRPCAVGRRIGGKTGAQGAYIFLKIGANEAENSIQQYAFDSYQIGFWLGASRPGGGSWVRSDFDPNNLEYGHRAASTDASPRLTKMLYPSICYSEASLPLSTTPVAVAAAGLTERGFLRGVQRGVMRGAQ